MIRVATLASATLGVAPLESTSYSMRVSGGGVVSLLLSTNSDKQCRSALNAMPTTTLPGGSSTAFMLCARGME